MKADTRRSGFSLAQLIVAIAIVCTLVALLLPAVNHSVSVAKQASCASNLRQIHNAILQYTGDHNGYLPAYSEVAPNKPNLYWISKIKPYLGQPVTGTWDDNDPVPLKLFRCPGDPRPPTAGSYSSDAALDGSYGLCGLNGLLWGVWPFPDGSPRNNSHTGFPQSSVIQPAHTAMLFDHDLIFASGPDQLRKSTYAFRHNNRINVLFFDGHLETVLKGTVPDGSAVFWKGN